MLKHIVMMKLKQAEVSVFKERQLKLESILKELKNHIPSLHKIEIGLNISDRPTAYDIVLVSEFKNEADLNEYRVHPKHVDALSYIKEVVAEAKVVDYII